MIERQVSHLVRLVDDLLDVSRIMRGRIELRLERVEFASIVERALETVRPAINAAGHQLTTLLPSERVELLVDPIRLVQVIANLLNNAARYTEPGGHIWLSAELEPGSIAVRIRDSGIGIAAEVLPRVFDLFTQIDRSAQHSQGGLGIGLTLVKTLVELHGGQVWASSEAPAREANSVSGFRSHCSSFRRPDAGIARGF